MFRKIALVDSLHIGPIVLDCEFFELGLILVVPGAQSALLLLGEGTGASQGVLSSVAHLDILADVILVGHFGVTFHHCELLLVLARRDGGEVAALDLGLVETVEEGKRNVLVTLMGEGPVDPLFVLELEVLQNTQVDIHC
jgi:hypothetical protein